MPQWRMAQPVEFEAFDGEHIAIVGNNGSGKTMLTDIIIGRHPLLLCAPTYDFRPSLRQLAADNIKYISFRDCYGADNEATYYLQQRWNQHDIYSETPTVGQLLEEAFSMAGESNEERRDLQSHLYEIFGLKELLDKYIILLSSGELRKFQLCKALFFMPRILIMDNPFIGLDSETREQLKVLLTTLSKERALQIILVLAKRDEIPDFITHIVEVNDMVAHPKKARKSYFTQLCPKLPELSAEKKEAILNLPPSDKDYHAKEVVRLNKVSIRYGTRTILKDLDWVIRNGDRWALTGKNGSGKSTLLSLICADNPQSYACDITLFDQRRGTGETIWDIKRHIGYVSPEMHRAYKKDMECIRVVASGLKDSVGLFVHPTASEYETCKWWMNIFGIGNLQSRRFMSLSSGEQRMVLLARAFVKDPELLILDEPFHGLDAANSHIVRQIINAFCERPNKTLIMVSHYMEELPSCISKHLHLEKI